MVRNSNFWFDTYPTEQRVYSGVPSNADVVIIGGGVMGISTLFHLLAQDNTLNVVLLEEATVAEHASGRSSGQLMIKTGKDFSDMKPGDAQEYIQFLERSVQATKWIVKKADIDCNLVESGGLHMSEETDGMSVEHQTLQRHLKYPTTIQFDEKKSRRSCPQRFSRAECLYPSKLTSILTCLSMSLQQKLNMLDDAF